MSIILQNKNFTVKIKELGAELVSVVHKESKIEYIWQGNPVFWPRHAPVLFPIVGALKDDVLTYQGKKYPDFHKHGYVRDEIFRVVGKSASQVMLEITNTNLDRFPMNYVLKITYTLQENGLKIEYNVKNPGKNELIFSIGGHPAFNTPLDKGTFETATVQFNPAGEYTSIPLNGPASDFANASKADFTKKVNITRQMFDPDVIIFGLDGKSSSVSLGNEKSDHGVTIELPQVDYIGIWSPFQTEAPFICLEPWWGIHDTVDSDGKFENKKGVTKLNGGEEKKFEYSLKFY